MTRTIGTAAFGLRAPILKEGDNLEQVVVDTILNAGIEIKDRDIVGITESIVARCEGNYVTIDEVAEEIKKLSNNADVIIVDRPIYSRNRFAMILKAIARGTGKKVVIIMPPVDEVGNVIRNHPFTKLNYDEYYKSIVEGEGKECEIIDDIKNKELLSIYKENPFVIDARMYFTTSNLPHEFCTLADICKDKCEYGLYGSNKSSEEMLKLFPSKKYSQNLVEKIQSEIYIKIGKTIGCFVFGDGCYKDPDSGIFEFADPIVCPAYTTNLEGTPNEIKIKNFADEKYKDLHGEELDNAIKEEIRNRDINLCGSMASQGTTPRKYTNLLGSLADLTTASGQKGTPFVYIQGYFDSYADD